MKKILLATVIFLAAGSAQAAQQTILGGTGFLWGNEKVKINSNFTELYGQAATKWVTGKSYTADNQMVAHGGHLFICTSNHTSGATTEPGTGATWSTVWKYHGSDLYAATLGADDNYVTDSEKARLGDLEATDDVAFASVTATGFGGLASGVQFVQDGSVILYSNDSPHVFGISQATDPTESVGLKAPPSLPTADNSMLNFDINGTGGWTDPATFAAALGADDNYVTDSEKALLPRLGDLEAADTVSFAGVTATGAGGLVSGVASTTQGSLILYSNVNNFGVSLNPAAIPTENVTIKLPAGYPAGANYLWNVNASGVSGWTDPASFAPALGVNDNYVTDAEKAVLGNTSGTNTGDQVVPSSINDLSDVNTTGKATGKILKFNSSGDLVVGDDSIGEAGTGDMILANDQTVTGLKTFDSAKLAVRGSSTGSTAFENTNNTATNYTLTLPNASGTLARLADIPPGGGDMLLGTAQTVTAAKTFEPSTLLVKGSSTGTTAITSANTGATNYTLTLPAADGNLARISDIPTSASGISFSPEGSISATNVQAAIQEVRDEAGGGSMTWPGSAGIPNYTGSSSWGTSYTLDTDLSSVSASDDSLPSAKATKAALDLKANSTGLVAILGALSDMKILDAAQPVTGQQFVLDTMAYGNADDALHLWSIDKIGSELAGKQAADADLTTWAGITPSANGQSLVGAANYAAMRGLLDLEADTDFAAYGKNPVVTASKATTYTIGTDSANELFGGTIYVTSAATITAPAIAVGHNYCVTTIGDIAVSLDVNGSDKMILDGVTLADGDKATNTSKSGDTICCQYYSADGQYCWSGTVLGGHWTDGN